MIVRLWHGRTKTTDAETYRQFVIETGIKEYTSTNGNLGAQIWQRQEGAITHIWTVSWWKNIESIRAFAGEEIEKANTTMTIKTIYWSSNQRLLIMRHLILPLSLKGNINLNTNGCPFLFA